MLTEIIKCPIGIFDYPVYFHSKKGYAPLKGLIPLGGVDYDAALIAANAVALAVKFSILQQR